MTAEDARGLADHPVGRWRDHVEGIGLMLSAELGRRAGIALAEPPGERWPRVFDALRTLVDDPGVTEADRHDDLRDLARAEKAESLRRALREPLLKRRTLLLNQLGDVERSMQAYEDAQSERYDADLLMAYAHLVPVGAASARLPKFDGEGDRELELDPALSAVQNAERLYSRARRREEVFDRLADREPRLRDELADVEERLERLGTAPLEALELLERELVDVRAPRSPLGMRYRTPSGFEVLVGRNNKENDVLTHRVGRSLDYWFHAQGYPGSHVLVRTAGRELSLPDILMAASLAAYHSRARASGNVPVDYTRVKHVWKPRGAPAGKVHYTQQKTVYVDPAEPESTG